MLVRPNRRRALENFVQREHLKLSELKKKEEVWRLGLYTNFLSKENIPEYPRPELHVTHLKHDTERDGLRGIRTDGGFRNPGLWRDVGFRNPDPNHLLWWSLAVEPDDIQAAERRLLKRTFSNRTKEQVQRQQGFLRKFATSPAFDQRSMFGSYRFTFPLEKILKAYSEQFCSGDEPVMRVHKTVLYKQEVMYVVLVHSPDDNQKFSLYPRLADDPDPICYYRDGCFIWRPEAMCETHRFRLVRRNNERRMAAVKASGRHEFYVWDHVALALHVDDKVLKFDARQLRKNLNFCDRFPIKQIPEENFDTFAQANELVEELWPNGP